MKKSNFPFNFFVLLLTVFVVASCRKDDVILQIPEVSTFPVTDIAYQSATCGGIVNSAGAAITARGVCWSTKSTPTVLDNITSTMVNENGSFTISISNLKSDSIYYIRAFATNSVGTGYGNVIQFKTKRTSINVVTATLSDISYQSVTCGGAVSSEGTLIKAYGICWSSHTTPTLRDSITFDGLGEGSFTSNIKSLKPDSTYYVRAYALSDNDTVYGSTMKFKTKHASFSVNSLSAINTQQTATTFGGKVTVSSGTTIISRGVCYSLSSYPTVDDNFVESTEISSTFHANITNLQPNQRYYARAYASTYNAIIYGENVIFKTRETALNISDPQFTSLAATTATVSANVTSESGSIISHGVCWNKTGDPTVLDSKTDEGAETGDFSTTMNGLLPATTYYMRSYALDNQSAVYGNTSIFRTNESGSIGAPSIVIVSSIKSGSVTTLNCKIVYQGSSAVTQYGYYMSTKTNPSPTNYNSGVTQQGTVTNFALTLSTTIPGYTFAYVRAFATNSKGTGYSDLFIYSF